LGSSTITTDGTSAVLLVDDPKAALGAIVELVQRLGVQLEWLTVRQNTLEDVFLRSIQPGGEALGRS
jgi:hypothetical protein